MCQAKGFDFPFDKAANIRMLILDVDGVLTNCSIIMVKHGDEHEAFNVREWSWHQIDPAVLAYRLPLSPAASLLWLKPGPVIWA